MELTPLLIYESFLLAIGVAAVISFAVFYFRLLRGYNKLRLEHDRMNKELDEYGNVVTATSKEHIRKLVEHSNELSSQLKGELTKLLEAQAQKESGAYKHVVEGVGDALEKASKAQVEQFAQTLSKEVKESEVEVREKIAKLYDTTESEVQKLQSQVNKEVMDMRAQAAKELREKIYVIVSDVVEQTTGKLLSREDHEGIVRERLETALRSQGVSTNDAVTR